MKYWKILAALPLLAGGMFAAAVEGLDQVLPEKYFPALDQILRSAVNQSPRMLDQALNLEIAENDRIAARAALLPSASAFIRDYESHDRRADLDAQGLGATNVRKFYYDASVVQPVFFWGERRNVAKMGEIRQKITQGLYQQAYQMVAQDLRSRYLGLITLKVLAERARFNQKFTHELLRVAEERLKNKVISDLEIFPTRLNAERADIDVERTAFDLEAYRQTIARLSGAPVPEEEAIPEAIPAVPYNPQTFDRLLADFLSQKDMPAIDAINARRQLEVQNLDYLNQKTRLRPKFSLAAGTSQDEQNYNLGYPPYRVTSLYAGVQVSWTIFDGFASRSAVLSSLARRRQLEVDYKDLTSRLTEVARNQSRQIYFSSRTMSIDDRFLTSNEGNVKARQDDFTRGVIPESDVSMAQLGLFDARYTAYAARQDFLARVAEFLGTINADPVVANAPVN